jgi:hypothetical protein
MTKLVCVSRTFRKKTKVYRNEMKNLTSATGHPTKSEISQVELERMVSQAPTVDVFISLEVESSLVIGRSLKEYLERNFGATVFMCDDVINGPTFREQIIDNLEKCRVFIPIVNEQWAESTECGEHFNYARQMNLALHKMRRSRAPTPRMPVILPVHDKGFNHLAYQETRLLASSTNFTPINFDDPTATWKKICYSIKYLKIAGFPALNLSNAPALPIKKEVEPVAEELFEFGEQQERALDQFTTEISNSLLSSRGGTFILSGQTVNDYDGNTTVTDRCLITFCDGVVRGTIDYKAGTLYNSSDIAPIEGVYDVEKQTATWSEIYHHGRSHFVYSGEIDENSIRGTYYWQEKPTARGHFEFKLERWL